MRSAAIVGYVEGVLPARRNLLRYHGTPVRVSIAAGSGIVMDLETAPRLVEVSEAAFDEHDVNVTGVPVMYCCLAPGLCAVWPTADKDYAVNVMVEI